MARTRLPMRKLREILRLKLDLGASVREIAQSCNPVLSGNSARYRRRARRAFKTGCEDTWDDPPSRLSSVGFDLEILVLKL